MSNYKCWKCGKIYSDINEAKHCCGENDKEEYITQETKDKIVSLVTEIDLSAFYTGFYVDKDERKSSSKLVENNKEAFKQLMNLLNVITKDENENR